MQIQIIATLASLAIGALAAPVEESQPISYERALLLSREFEAIAPRMKGEGLSKRSPCMDDCVARFNEGGIGRCITPGCNDIAYVGKYVSTLTSRLVRRRMLTNSSYLGCCTLCKGC